METLSVLLAICEGNPPITGGFLSQKAREVKLLGFRYSKPERAVEQIDKGR